MMLQSIKAADYGDEMMLLALGNRSAVNYELKLYQVRAWVVSSHTRVAGIRGVFTGPLYP